MFICEKTSSEEYKKLLSLWGGETPTPDSESNQTNSMS